MPQCVVTSPPDFLRKWVREYVPIVFVAVEVIEKNKKMEISIF